MPKFNYTLFSIVKRAIEISANDLTEAYSKDKVRVYNIAIVRNKVHMEAALLSEFNDLSKEETQEVYSIVDWFFDHKLLYRGRVISRQEKKNKVAKELKQSEAIMSLEEEFASWGWT